MGMGVSVKLKEKISILSHSIYHHGQGHKIVKNHSNPTLKQRAVQVSATAQVSQNYT